MSTIIPLLSTALQNKAKTTTNLKQSNADTSPFHNSYGRTIIETIMKLSAATKYILEAFIPYTNANLKLVYKPSAFFYEHERLSRTKRQTLKSAYYRAIKKGLLEVDDQGVPRLTAKGKRMIKTYKPARLPRGACLLVVFDIKEAERFKRNHLRALLKELSFKKVQQSVWMTRHDHREYLAMELKEYGLENSVIVYEALQLPLIKIK